MIKRKLASVALPRTLFLLVAMQAHAQNPPDAGALQQQIDRERQQQLPEQLAPQKPAVPPPMSPPTGAVITVAQFRFVGNTLLSAEQLAPAVADYLDRPLDFRQLQAAAAAVAEVYRAAGWIVRAYLPAQDIKDGIVTIQIVEAVFGQVRHESPGATQVSPSRIDAIVLARQQPGSALNAMALDRGLLLADDLPGVSVAASLAAGASERETDLILTTADDARVAGDVSIDNTGSRATGEERLNANVNLASPAGWGDLASASLSTTEGSDYGRLAYSLPLGSDGWRAGASASELRYKLIEAPLDPATDRGTSTILGLDAGYPVIRSRQQNLYVNLTYDHKDFDNRLSAAPDGIASRYKMNVYSIALNGNHFDNLGGGGANSVNLTLASGHRGSGIDTTEQYFTKLRYSLSRQQVITSELAFYLAISGQYATKNLDSAERFYLGGAYGLRAYPSGEAGGSSAYLATTELRWRAIPDLMLTGFVDSGAVRNHDNAGNNYDLSGAGIALAWKAPFGLYLNATWAARLGENPYPADTEESSEHHRFWLSASLPF